MPRRLHRLDVALLAGMSLAAAAVASRFMEPGYPSAWDGGAHFVRLRAMAELFLPHGRTDGWCPWWFDGFVPFQFYPSLFFVVVAGLYHLLGGTVALLTLFKLAIIAAWALLPPAVWVLARTFRFSRYGALVAAGASLGLSAPQGIGIQGLFGIGLIPQGVGLLLFCLGLAALHVGITVGGRHVPRAALLAAAVVCTHIISGVYLAIAGALYVVMALSRRRWRRRRTLRRAFVIAALTTGMCVATLAPLVIWPELRGPGTGWSDHHFLPDFLAGRLFSGPIVTWLAVAFVVGLRVRRFETAFLVTLALLTAPFAAGAVTTGIGPVDDVARQILRHRALPYLALLTALFAGGACDVLRRWAARVPLAGYVVAGVLATLVVWETQAGVRSLAWIIQVDAHHTTTEKANFLKAFHWLRDHAANPTVVGFDDRYDERFGEPGYTQLASRIVLEAERSTLLGNQPEATLAHNGEVLVHLHDWEPDRILAALRRYDVGYLIAWVDEVEQNLTRSPAFSVVYRAGGVRVFAVDGVGGFASGDGIRVEAADLQPERMVWLLRNDQPAPAQATLAVAWHPNWRAALGGLPVPLGETEDHLSTVTLGPGPVLLTLTWVRPWWNPVLNLASAGVLLVTVLIWWRNRKHT
ncbi:MAG TPA: hypothetical protein VGR62_05930 [Candidatus Binatia bacterium]|nr:hypothetical protein [Candidatus Binatia bacterium]